MTLEYEYFNDNYYKSISCQIDPRFQNTDKQETCRMIKSFRNSPYDLKSVNASFPKYGLLKIAFSNKHWHGLLDDCPQHLFRVTKRTLQNLKWWAISTHKPIIRSESRGDCYNEHPDTDTELLEQPLTKRSLDKLADKFGWGTSYSRVTP